MIPEPGASLCDPTPAGWLTLVALDMDRQSDRGLLGGPIAEERRRGRSGRDLVRLLNLRPCVTPQFLPEILAKIVQQAWQIFPNLVGLGVGSAHGLQDRQNRLNLSCLVL